MLMTTGKGCCNGAAYDRYKVVMTSTVSAIVDNPTEAEDYVTEDTYFLCKLVFKTTKNNSFVQTTPLDSHALGDWSIILNTFHSVGVGQHDDAYGEIATFNPDLTAFDILSVDIIVWADDTDEYAYIIVPRNGRLKLIKVHTIRKLILYETELVLSGGQIFDIGSGYILSPYRYALNTPRDLQLGHPETLVSDRQLNVYATSTRLIFSSIGSPQDDIFAASYNPPLAGRSTPRELFVYIEIDVFTGLVTKEIIDYDDYQNHYQPIFHHSMLIQDENNILGAKVTNGDPRNGIPNKIEFVTGKLTTLPYDVPIISDYVVIKTLNYGNNGFVFTPRGFVANTNNEYVLHWGQDVLKHTYISLGYAPYGPDFQPLNGQQIFVDVFNNGVQVEHFVWDYETEYPNFSFVFIESCFSDGYILVKNQIQPGGLGTTEITSTRSDDTPRWIKTFNNAGTNFRDTGELLCNDKWIHVNRYPVPFSVNILDEAAGLSHVSIDSGFKYTDYIYTGDEGYFYLNIEHGTYEPVVLCKDPANPLSGYGTDVDGEWIVDAEFDGKLIYDVLINYNVNAISNSLNFIRLSGLPDSYFDTTGH